MFIFSKLLSAITQPMFWLALWWGLALLVLMRWRRPALVMLWGGLAGLSGHTRRLAASAGKSLSDANARLP